MIRHEKLNSPVFACALFGRGYVLAEKGASACFVRLGISRIVLNNKPNTARQCVFLGVMLRIEFACMITLEAGSDLITHPRQCVFFTCDFINHPPNNDSVLRGGERVRESIDHYQRGESSSARQKPGNQHKLPG